MALTAAYHDPVTEIGTDGFQSFTKLPAAVANKLLENDMYLKARPILIVQDLDGTIMSTSSTSFVNVTGMSGSITTVGSSKLLLMASFHWIQTGAPSTCYATVAVDGTNQGHATNGLIANTGSTTIAVFACLQHVTAALSDATHTVALRTRVSSGSIDFKMATLIAAEVG